MTSTLERPSFGHAFPAGTFFVRISATDVAGNATVVTRKIVIKKPKKTKKGAEEEVDRQEDPGGRHPGDVATARGRRSHTIGA